ncbi:MAG: hypothetical protein ACYTDU_14900 [Planctomycetota bacterium]|jgi:hypothetical protein
MSSNRIRIARTLLAGLAAALLGLPGAAAADSEQIGVVLEKDVASGTLKLEGGAVLQVTSATVITGLSGQRITLEEVPAAVDIGEGYEVDGDETIRFEAVKRGSKRVASSIQLLDAPLD